MNLNGETCLFGFALTVLMSIIFSLLSNLIIVVNDDSFVLAFGILQASAPFHGRCGYRRREVGFGPDIHRSIELLLVEEIVRPFRMTSRTGRGESTDKVFGKI